MGITSTNFTDLSYIPEATPGATPVSPIFQILPTTSGAPSGQLATAVSEAIRSDRQTDDLIVVDSEVGGDFDYELSYNPYKPLIISLLQATAATATISSASADVTFAAPSGDNQVLTDNVGTAFAGVVAGQYLRIAGAASAFNNGIFKVGVVTDDSNITIENSTGVAAANDVSGITFDASVYRNGATGDVDSYTFCKRVLGVDNPAFFYYRGIQISEMSFNFETGAILGGSASLMGFSEEVTESAIAGQSFIDPPAHDLMNSVTSIANIDIGGLASTTKFSNLDLTVNNNVNSAKQIGVLGAADLASFTLDITGNISIYFEDIAAYNSFKTSASFDLAFTLLDASGNTMIISMPKVKFETLDAPISGKDNFLLQEGSIRALRDSTTDHMIQISFFDAP